MSGIRDLPSIVSIKTHARAAWDASRFLDLQLYGRQSYNANSMLGVFPAKRSVRSRQELSARVYNGARFGVRDITQIIVPQNVCPKSRSQTVSVKSWSKRPSK